MAAAVEVVLEDGPASVAAAVEVVLEDGPASVAAAVELGLEDGSTFVAVAERGAGVDEPDESHTAEVHSYKERIIGIIAHDHHIIQISRSFIGSRSAYHTSSSMQPGVLQN